MNHAIRARHFVGVAAITLSAVGCGSRPAPIATAEPPTDLLDAEPTVTTPAAAMGSREAGSLVQLTEGELDELERTLDEMDTLVDELEQGFGDD